MSEEVVIREATVDDAEDFIRANEASWNAGMEGLVPKKLGELASFEDRVAGFRAGIASAPPGARVWVAERNGHIVGHAGINVAHDGTGELRSLYVVPDEWGTGVARALHDHALTEMRELDASVALLWVVEGNVRARRFYERQGWSEDGETKASMFDITELRYRHPL